MRGADRENPAERPVLTVAQVFELADAMRVPRVLRALILVTAFSTLRWGEVTALRRCDVAPDGSWVRVSVAHTEMVGRGIVVGPPKSRAGVRTVAVPKPSAADIVKHLMTYVDARAGCAGVHRCRRVARSGARTSTTSRTGWRR